MLIATFNSVQDWRAIRLRNLTIWPRSSGRGRCCGRPRGQRHSRGPPCGPSGRCCRGRRCGHLIAIGLGLQLNLSILDRHLQAGLVHKPANGTQDALDGPVGPVGLLLLLLLGWSAQATQDLTQINTDCKERSKGMMIYRTAKESKRYIRRRMVRA